MIDVCRNSGLRAYQYGCSTEAHVCIRPSGNRLRTHIAINPPFNDQKENSGRPSFHDARNLDSQADQHPPDTQHTIYAKQSSVVV
jgi:hypothetical protein